MKTTEHPINQPFDLEGVSHISPLDAMIALQNKEAIMIDVREMFELEVEKIPLENVYHFAMSTILQRIDELSKEKSFIILCTRGERSVKITNLFNIQGFKNVANLDGGIISWAKEGLPYEGQASNNECDGNCDCGSGSCC